MTISKLTKLLISAVVLAGVILVPVSGMTASLKLKPFKSDGCSLFPDGSLNNRTLWCSCCFEHDIAYWQGGTREQRKQADEDLKQCVMEKTGNDTLAQTMYLGVRAGGSPAFPTWYRWGYGWSYGRGYKPLDSKEQLQLSEMLPDIQFQRKNYRCQ